MSSPGNDSITATATFRDKVFFFYNRSKILPCSADLIATHYVSAVFRQGFDADKGPILPGCDKFGPEVSPREIIETHMRAKHPKAKRGDVQAMVKDSLASAEQEITRRSQDAYVSRCQLASAYL